MKIYLLFIQLFLFINFFCSACELERTQKSVLDPDAAWNSLSEAEKADADQKNRPYAYAREFIRELAITDHLRWLHENQSELLLRCFITCRLNAVLREIPTVASGNRPSVAEQLDAQRKGRAFAFARKFIKMLAVIDYLDALMAKQHKLGDICDADEQINNFLQAALKQARGKLTNQMKKDVEQKASEKKRVNNAQFEAEITLTLNKIYQKQRSQSI